MTNLHPAAAGLDFAAEIALQSAAFAAAAEGNLAAPVQHCPGWTVADLVNHLTEVQWFWALVVEQLPSTPPEGEEPARPADDELLPRFRAGALHLDEVLRAADPAAHCWTWAPQQQDVGFVLRHQVQEAAVHRWDAEHAAGRDVTLSTAASVDAIEEFLTFSISTSAGYQKQDGVPLAGAFVLAATDADAAWTISDDSQPGTMRFDRGAQPDLPVLSGTASDLLLWLYRRIELPVPAGATELIDRFHALGFTD
jgi:uncharacterized protein (TIGR03083 family)